LDHLDKNLLWGLPNNIIRGREWLFDTLYTPQSWH